MSTSKFTRMTVIDQRRIAKNAMLLYVRMAVVMLVSLYTSRIVLDALGEVDFGIYNAVGGIVMMMAFINGAMASACNRFYAYELGREDYEGLHRTFNLCLFVFILIALLAVVLSETVGLWLLYRKIKVAGRMAAARWVFQCSIVSVVFVILRTPYMAMVTIREKMKVFAYVSVFEACGNLAVALMLLRTGSDKLILYSVLMMCVSIVVTLFYVAYCTIFYKECRYRFYFEKTQFAKLFSFAGWSMFGSASLVCQNQGVNILLNIFFGPVINAARGMAYKVFATLRQFVENFITAFYPQLLKSYSSGDVKGTLKLVNQTSRFAYYLMLIVALPFLFEMPFILDVWLKDVPEHTTLFARLALVNSLIIVLESPLNTVMQAHGDIRNYQIATGLITLSVLPVGYLLFKLHFAPESIYYVTIILCLVALAVRVLYVRNAVGLSTGGYLSGVIAPVLKVSVASALVPLLLEISLPDGTMRFFVVSAASVVMTAVSIYFLGMSGSERAGAVKVIKEKFGRRA